MVAGIAGDAVCALDTALTVNGTTIAEVPPPAAAPERPALRGCEIVAPGMVYLVGLHPRSLDRSEEHTSELQSLMRISYAVFCLKKTKHNLQIVRKQQGSR